MFVMLLEEKQSKLYMKIT